MKTRVSPRYSVTQRRCTTWYASELFNCDGVNKEHKNSMKPKAAQIRRAFL